MSSSGSQSQSTSTAASSKFQGVRKKLDPAWEHCNEQEIDVNGVKTTVIVCLYCGHVLRGGGIHRMKQHLAGQKGDSKRCTKVPVDIRYRLQENLKTIHEKKQAQDQWEDPNIYGDGPSPQEAATPQRSQGDQQTGKRKASASEVPSYFAPRTTPGAQPGIQRSFKGKDAVYRADLAIARFLFDSCIPINVLNSPYYQPMIDAIAGIGSGYKGPNYHAMRTKLLYDMKKEVQLLVDACRNTWAETGCTIMADGWQDQKNRQLINFLVYSPKGITFVRSVDASDVVKDAETLCNLFTELVEYVGPSNVIHLVTDNAANYKAAGRKLNDKYPSIFWSPCAAHCLNLILADIGKMEHVSNLAKRASSVTKFIYNHAFLLAWLRKREGWNEIIRPGPTRFATTFIALKSLLQRKHDLTALVTSKTFTDSRYAKDRKAKDVMDVVINNKFWNDVGIIVRIVAPLVRLLRIVDADERPSIGYVYDGMYRAKKAIKNILLNRKSWYKPYTKIIKERWDKQLRQKIHAAAYYLNPNFCYGNDFSTKPEVTKGFLDVVEARVTSGQTKFVQEASLYLNKQDSFGRPLAMESCKKMQPDEWWRMFGYSAPNVKKLAIQILSQTASSSGCERNWSVFERIHTKKRNRLEHQRLNDLVFVHYNLRLKNKMMNKKRSFDPIDYESIEDNEFWVMEDDDSSLLDYDELENMLYDVEAIPTNAENVDKGDDVKQVDGSGPSVAVDAVDLESFAIDNDNIDSSYYDRDDTHAWFDQDPPQFENP